jgi:hypothetical protein
LPLFWDEKLISGQEDMKIKKKKTETAFAGTFLNYDTDIDTSNRLRVLYIYKKFPRCSNNFPLLTVSV